MTNQDLEWQLADAVTKTAPNDLEGVLSRCETRKGTVIPMTTRKKTHVTRNLIAACLALILVGGGGTALYQQAYAVSSVVSLDVNPSIELTVNRRGKVLECRGLNEEARAVLAGLDNGADLKGTKLDVAVYAVVGALVSSGYLDSLSSAILISVEDGDLDRAARLQQELAAAVDVVLQERSSDAAVLSQTVSRDETLEQQAQANNISTGKAALINQVLALNNTLNFEALSTLSVEELRDLVKTGAPAMPIGRDAAGLAAREYAGLMAVSAVSWEVDAELDDTPAHYEVELRTPGGELEYEYIVAAYTGEILRGRADVLGTAEEPEEELIGGEAAFDLAAQDFLSRNPELSGNNILDHKVELDRDDGTVHYDVEFLVGGYEVDYEIDAYTGAILRWDSEYEGPATQPDPPAASESPTAGDIGSAAAKQAALAHAGLSESQVKHLKVERDYDHGRLEYEVEFKSGGVEYEYTIDAATGAVLEHEKDCDHRDCDH